MSSNEELPPLLTLTQLAEHLQVHPDTARTWVRKRLIPHLCLAPGAGRSGRGVIRFDPERIREWTSGMSVEPARRDPGGAA